MAALAFRRAPLPRPKCPIELHAIVAQRSSCNTAAFLFLFLKDLKSRKVTQRTLRYDAYRFAQEPSRRDASATRL